MQTVKDKLFNLVEELKSVEHKKDAIYPVCTTVDGTQFHCVKVEGKEWDYESLM